MESQASGLHCRITMSSWEESINFIWNCWSIYLTETCGALHCNWTKS